MGWMHCRKVVELITDPSSKELSMSRFLLPWLCLLDAAWALAAVKGWPPKDSYGPVSSMLGIVTGAVCGIYGLNSVGGAVSRYFNWSQVETTAPPLPPPEKKRGRVKPAEN
ncbi:MAG: hypothetical protein A2Y80_02250 [Deltaproteobacteria bacterium RBG_13_58_19]|nr:MAG: hypothetical protein A2Y80_02250 [Deltaproteobacteria bacterium RBG_13_58_19]